MNNDQIKESLLKLYQTKEDFSVILTGKKSNAVHGFYKPAIKTIYLHNKNFKETTAGLFLTAIHEYAHHIHSVESPLPIGSKCHTQQFYNILEMLYKKAIELNFVKDYRNDPEIKELSEKIKKDYIEKQNDLVISNAENFRNYFKICCDRSIVDPFVFAENDLGITQKELKKIRKAIYSPVNHIREFGFEKTVFVETLSPGKKETAITLFEEKDLTSISSVKQMLNKTIESQSEDEILTKERARLQKTIATLNKRLEEVENKLKQFELDFGESN